MLLICFKKMLEIKIILDRIISWKHNFKYRWTIHFSYYKFQPQIFMQLQ